MQTTDQLNAALTGRYRIERELGAGGMATVYLAEDLKHHRRVAIKVLRNDLTASLGKERFLREVGIAAALQHPHILPLYDSGEADGLLYYVMPFVDGQSLREKLVREGELPVPDAVRILRDIADALAEAHKYGVVHRDLKPENVMLRGRHALVTDFGVAKALSEATGRNSLTSIGIALGTPMYMAPEQATADPHTDHRADIYAFGVVAYELLAGRPPFTGTTPQQILAAHITAAVEPVSVHRALPPVLSGLVMKCLEKKPADRWQHAEELISVLEAVLTPSGGMTPAGLTPGGTIPVDTSRPVRRKWVVAGIGAALIAVAAIGIIIAKQPGTSAAAEVRGGRVAVFPFAVRSGDSADMWLAEGLSEQIGSRLARAAELKVLSTTSIASQLRKTPDPLDAARAMQARWVVTGQLRHTGREIEARTEIALADSGVQTWSATFRRPDGDLRLLEAEVAESVAVVLVGARNGAAVTARARAVSADPEAYRLFLLGNAQTARRTAETAMQAAANYQLATRRDPKFAEAWAMLGRLRVIQHSWTPWKVDVPRDSLAPHARRAIAAALALDPNNWEALKTSGMIEGWVNADYVEATRIFDRVLAMDSLDADGWHSIGVIKGADRENDLPLAERHLRRAISLDPDLPNTWRHLAKVVAWQGRLAESEAILDTLIVLGQWAPAYLDRAVVRAYRGNGAAALGDLRMSFSLAGATDSARLAQISIVAGDTALATRWLAGAKRSGVTAAVVLVALKRNADALAVLERDTHDAAFWAGLHDPVFSELRSDPRFQRLLDKSRPKGAK